MLSLHHRCWSHHQTMSSGKQILPHEQFLIIRLNCAQIIESFISYLIDKAEEIWQSSFFLILYIQIAFGYLSVT